MKTIIGHNIIFYMSGLAYIFSLAYTGNRMVLLA